MGKPTFIELGDGQQINILYEDRSVIALDKPPGWMLVPHSWQKTNRNLQAAIVSSIAAGDFWARSRNLRFLRHVHRLDADTSGVLLMAKSQGAVNSLGDLFEEHRMEKFYLAVVTGTPKQNEWVCRLKLAPDPNKIGRMVVDDHNGKEAETSFRVLQTKDNQTLVEAHPYTGRTHQIRVHLAESGSPIVGDPLYGKIRMDAKTVVRPQTRDAGMGLRAIHLAYSDPFTKRPVRISAPTEAFIREFGFDYVWRLPGQGPATPPQPTGKPRETRPKPQASRKS